MLHGIWYEGLMKHKVLAVNWNIHFRNVFAAAAAAAKSLQSRLTLCDPIDGSPPGSPVPGILQARILECGCGLGPSPVRLG